MRHAALVVVLGAFACNNGGDPPAGGTSSGGPSSSSGGTSSSSAGTTSPADSSGTTSATTTPDETTTTDGDDNPCNDSPDAVADCVEAPRYAEDLEFIADIRTPGSPHWQAVQDLCFDRLTEAGFKVELHEYGTGVNVIGQRQGTTAPDDIVLLGAHYDHIDDCMGADDNATGVAAVLEIARVLGQVEFPRTVMVACWDEEELGLVGAEAFAMQAAADGLVLDPVFNFDMIGFRSDEPDSQSIPLGLDLVFPDAYADLQANEFRGDFVAIISNSTAVESVAAFQSQADRLGLSTADLALPAGTETDDLFADLRRSDHAAFWDAGYPAIFLGDTGEFRNTHYHCTNGPDVVADLDEDFAVAIARSTAGAAAAAAGL